jgi:hypothetical protein
MKTAISEANSSAWLALMISTAGFRLRGSAGRRTRHRSDSALKFEVTVDGDVMRGNRQGWTAPGFQVGRRPDPVSIYAGARMVNSLLTVRRDSGLISERGAHRKRRAHEDFAPGLRVDRLRGGLYAGARGRSDGRETGTSSSVGGESQGRQARSVSNGRTGGRQVLGPLRSA